MKKNTAVGFNNFYINKEGKIVTQTIDIRTDKDGHGVGFSIYQGIGRVTKRATCILTEQETINLIQGMIQEFSINPMAFLPEDSFRDMKNNQVLIEHLRKANPILVGIVENSLNLR